MLSHLDLLRWTMTLKPGRLYNERGALPPLKIGIPESMTKAAILSEIRIGNTTAIPVGSWT
jgi:hypothetical protein